MCGHNRVIQILNLRGPRLNAIMGSQSFGHLQSELGEGHDCMQSWAVSQLQSELGEDRDFVQSWAVSTHQWQSINDHIQSL